MFTFTTFIQGKTNSCLVAASEMYKTQLSERQLTAQYNGKY